jgi:ubiquinone/menaquinone biosynthesis C-methylase UbiE
MANGSLTAEIARSRAEVDQPGISARLLEPFSRQLFVEAGLKRGMRVLDVLSGAGDLALLAREIVGDEGHVTGFDTSAQSVAYANDRASFRGASNVEFVEARIEDLSFARNFDAVVGRVVLAYRPDPVSDLKSLARCVRPGGLLIFQEFDHFTGRTYPLTPLVEELREWLVSAFERSGIELEMGGKLYSTFDAAGLPPPRMRLDGLIGGAASQAPLLMVNVIRMLLPQLEALRIATPDEVQIDTLEDRIRGELERTGAVMQGSLLMGAWSRLPG